jgi:hypothetical protein
VAEIILSNTSDPVDAWNLPNNQAAHLNAYGYVNVFLGEEIWQKNEKAITFLSWAYNFPMMMEERARAFALLHKLRYVQDIDKEGIAKILQDFYRMADTPNPRLIEEVMRPILEKGRLVPPWERVGVTVEEAFGPEAAAIMENLDRQFLFHPEVKNIKSPCLTCESRQSCVDYSEKLLQCPWGAPSSNCGDCGECDNFDECAESLIKEDVDCVECSECEIEGFCSSSTTDLPKGPRYRH